MTDRHAARLGNWLKAAANRVYRLPQPGYLAIIASITSNGVADEATVRSKSSM